MSIAALTLFGVYLGVGFVLRSWLQWHRTGDAGFRGISRQPGAERSPESRSRWPWSPASSAQSPR